MDKRLTASVDEETVREAEAMSQRAQRERLQEVLSAIRAEIGPATDEETAYARSVLGL